MVKNIKELQKFLVWAKKEKIKKVKIQDMEFEFSELALVPEEFFNEQVTKPMNKAKKVPGSKEQSEVEDGFNSLEDEVDSSDRYKNEQILKMALGR